MFSNFLENAKLLRHVLEDLPSGVYILDRERRVCFWNRNAEHLTGHLSHNVVGHTLEDVVHACDRQGNSLHGELCPITATLSHGQPQHCTAFYLHKDGHRVAVSIRTRPILDHGDAIGGTTVLFDEAFVEREDSRSAPMYGCLDATTGMPSRRLTRAVLNECMASLQDAHLGFGILRIQLVGLDEFRSKHGPQSVLPFLRSAAQTLRHSLDTESFLGCWGEHEFMAVLPSASPVTVTTTAETLWNLLQQSEVLWWGDRFPVETSVCYAVAEAGKNLSLDSLLQEMKPCHCRGKAEAAAANDIGHRRG